MIKTIGLILPSGNIKEKEIVNKKIDILSKSYNVKKFYDENIHYGYVSDSVENRVKYLQKAFLDDEVDLVLSVRGGFGAIEIVDKIDYFSLKNCNKYYLGSSDATILLMALSKNTNIKCFHSLMITNGFVDNLQKNIEIVENNQFNLELKPIVKGKLEGILWGGNLSSLVSLFSGEQYLPNEDITLFLEDLNEPIYKIDKMIYEIYRNQKLKEKIKGIIFGDFYFEENEIMPLFIKYSKIFNVPTYYTNQITHKKTNVTIPYGLKLAN